MANEPAQLLAKHLRTLTAAARVEGLPDRELIERIERFAAGRDEDAFAALVRRHGPMVLRVCRRVLHDGHDAEDVFQAAFLVLSRKAASLRRLDSVGCFLHGVAYRLALKARTQLAQQRMHESQAAVEKYAADPLAELSVREAQAILDDELARLPEKYRAPLVLCCLEGKTRDEAARQLGWSSSLVKSRLEQGRERLHQRLTRRGLTLPAALGTALLTEEAAPAALPALLIRAAVQTMLPGNGVSASVALLAESALGGTAIGKAKIVVVTLMLLTGALAAGMGAFSPTKPAEKQAETPSVAKALEPPKSEKPQPALTDRYGDPLPPGAIARIGTVHFREGDAIHALAYSPDGKMLASATGYHESLIRLWDATTGKQLFLFPANSGPLAFSPNGKLLASIGPGKSKSASGIHLWDTRTGKEVRALGHPEASGGTVAFSPDGRNLITGGGGHTVRFWGIDSGKEVRQFKDSGRVIWSFALSPDGKTLATTSPDNTICLWDAAKGKELRRLTKPKATPREYYYHAVFSPDSKIVASGGADGSVYLWDVATGRRRLTIAGRDKWRKPRGFSREGPAGSPWVITHPGLPQIRTCPIKAYGSSCPRFATDGTPSGRPTLAEAGNAAARR